MRTLFYIALFLIFTGCSGSQLSEQRARDLQLMNTEIYHGSSLLKNKIEQRINGIRYAIQEKGNPKDELEEFNKLNDFVKENFERSDRITDLITSAFHKAGGFSSEDPYVLDWKYNVSNDDFPLDSVFEIENAPVINITVLMLELHRRQYRILKETLGSIPDQSYHYDCEMILTHFDDASDIKVKIWSDFVMPLDSMEVNKTIHYTTNGKLHFSNEEWDLLNVKSIGIPLKDTVLTYYLHYN